MDLEAIKRMLLVKYPAFSGIVLNTQFIEREEVINDMILALITGQSVLMLGEPGTGKSHLMSLFSLMMRKYSLRSQMS